MYQHHITSGPQPPPSSMQTVHSAQRKILIILKSQTVVDSYADSINDVYTVGTLLNGTMLVGDRWVVEVISAPDARKQAPYIVKRDAEGQLLFARTYQRLEDDSQQAVALVVDEAGDRMFLCVHHNDGGASVVIVDAINGSHVETVDIFVESAGVVIRMEACEILASRKLLIGIRVTGCLGICNLMMRKGLVVVERSFSDVDAHLLVRVDPAFIDPSIVHVLKDVGESEELIEITDIIATLNLVAVVGTLAHWTSSS